MSDLPGYDAWKTRAPGDGPYDEPEAESETAFCPRCGAGQEDPDGFGVLCCESCDYCVHPSITDDVCDLCGQRPPLSESGDAG